MSEHLSSVPVIDQIVAPYPMGIEANPGPNGIDPSLPPDIIKARASQMGHIVVTVCLNTPVNTELGEKSYSELDIERLLEARAAQITEDRHIVEWDILDTIEATSGDNARRDAAKTTREDRIEPQFQDQYYDNQRKIEELESLGKRSLTPGMRANLSRLRQEQRILRRQHSPSDRIPTFRRISQRRRDRSAREGLKMLGKSEAQIADIMEGEGNRRGLRDRRESRETRRRERAEDEQTRNIISRKGVIIMLEDGRRHVIADVLPTPAQGFKFLGIDPAGEPIFDKDPAGKEILHDLYLPEIDKKTGRPKIDPATGRIVVKQALNPATGLMERVTAPRDDPHLRSGHDKTSGGIVAKGPFCYADGTPVHSKSISSDSFNPTDDRVVLKPLLSGAEAVEALVKGVGSGIRLTDKHITLGHLVRYVTVNPRTVESEATRKALLESHLIFKKPDSFTSSALRPPFDNTRGTGYFEKFNYVDPVTTRKARILQQTELYGVERIKSGRKKKRYKDRDARLSG